MTSWTNTSGVGAIVKGVSRAIDHIHAAVAAVDFRVPGPQLVAPGLPPIPRKIPILVDGRIHGPLQLVDPVRRLGSDVRVAEVVSNEEEEFGRESRKAAGGGKVAVTGGAGDEDSGRRSLLPGQE